MIDRAEPLQVSIRQKIIKYPTLPSTALEMVHSREILANVQLRRVLVYYVRKVFSLCIALILPGLASKPSVPLGRRMWLDKVHWFCI